MLSWVNPKIVVSDAGTKGKGLFAKEFIPRGELIVIDSGQIVENKLVDASPYSNFLDYAYQIEKGFHIFPAELQIDKIEVGFFQNHSCNPNCGANGPTSLVAMRDIQSGEEVTYDYAMCDANYEGMHCMLNKPMECLCGAPNCRKIITGDDWRRGDLQEKYKGYFSPYLQRMIDDLPR